MMNISAKYLDLLQEKTETGTDYAVGKLLNESRSRLSSYRTGKTKFNEEMCFKVANVLDVEPMEVIAAIKLEQCKEKEDAEMAGFWADTLKKTSVTLSAAFLTIGMSLPGKVEAAQFNIINIMSAFSSFDLTIIYIMPLKLWRFIVTEITKHSDKINGYLNPSANGFTSAYI